MRFATILVMALGLMFSCGCASGYPIDEAATMRMEIEGDGLCSGTAVGLPGMKETNVVLTAAHCVIDMDTPKELKEIGFGRTPATYFNARGVRINIDRIIDDGKDHVFIVTDHKFKKFSYIAKKQPKVRDLVYYWGNAAGFNQLYRQGCVIGYHEGATLFDTNTWMGDSGAALYNKDKYIVGVVSFIGGDFIAEKGFVGGLKFMGAHPFNFTKEQFKEAGLVRRGRRQS